MPIFFKINKILSNDFDKEFMNESIKQIRKRFCNNSKNVCDPIKPEPPLTNIVFKI